MRLFRPGFVGGCLYPDSIFRIKTAEKLLFLSFDDGPDPTSTPLLLDILDKHNVRAQFFCTGRKAEMHPVLINQILNSGHQIGNHGYDHLDGWKTDSVTYFNDITRASGLTSDRILRPPYGRITYNQKKLLKSYKLIFWDLMAYDFDTTFAGESCLKVLINKIRPGSIIVLHDTPSSCANLILDEFLSFATSEGYRFELINSA
jgi:peptidoglycan-N-acetylglucosamine deacetylase